VGESRFQRFVRGTKGRRKPPREAYAGSASKEEAT
jgi:hypothetical protein